MPNLSIPEAIKEHSGLTSAAKLAYGEMFSRLKKGERVETQLRDIGLAITLGGDDLIEAIRCLAEKGYARIDESAGTLDNLVKGQEIRLTAHIHVEVLPIVPMDQDSVNERRYAAPNEAFWDEAQVGRTVYRATVGRMLSEWLLNIVARDDEGERTISSQMPHLSLPAAWEWFDAYIESIRKGYESTGLILDGEA